MLYQPNYDGGFVIGIIASPARGGTAGEPMSVVLIAAGASPGRIPSRCGTLDWMTGCGRSCGTRLSALFPPDQAR
jgi:hypothetical protein